MSKKNEGKHDHVRLNGQSEKTETVCWIQPGERLQAGMICPRCHKAKLDYNGLLHLTCPECGLTEAGACT